MTSLADLPDALDAAPRLSVSAADVDTGRLPIVQAEAALRLGPVLRIDVPVGPEAGPCIHFVSPELAEDVLVARRHLMSNAAGWAPIVGGGFGQAILNVDEPEHAEQRRLAAPAFAGPALQRYMPGLLAMIDAELDGWAREDAINLFPAMRRVTFFAVARGVGGMGEADAERALKALSTVLDGYEFLGNGREAFLARAAVARAQYLDVLSEIIARRRAGEGRGDGTMTDLFVSAIPPGDGPRDAVVPFLAILLIAGHDTGMVMYSRALHLLAHDPALATRLRRELEDAGATAARPLQTEALDRLSALDRTMLEIGRLYPSVVNLPRVVTEDIEAGGFRVTRGTRVAVAVAGMHRRPDIYADPHRFYPDRFADPQSARLTRPFLNLTFSGGARLCLGMRLAQIEFKAIVSRALLRYSLEPRDPAPVAHGGFWIARPSGPMVVSLGRR